MPQMPNNNEIMINGIKSQKTQRQFSACRIIPPKVGPSAGAIPVIILPTPIIVPTLPLGTCSKIILNINGKAIPVPMP